MEGKLRLVAWMLSELGCDASLNGKLCYHQNHVLSPLALMSSVAPLPLPPQNGQEFGCL